MAVEEEAPPPVAVQFETYERQTHALHFGMWIFLGSELLLFAGLFALYTAYRTEYTADFIKGVEHNELWIGTTNTVVLIVSSFTVAFSIHLLRAGRRKLCLLMLAITVLLGAVFLALKGLEYSDHFAKGIYPGTYYASHELPQFGSQLFFTMYYFMTGLHAIHMIAGILVVLWLGHRIWRYRTTKAHHPELEMGGLYWHLVDCIWIFLWPLFYLTG